MWADQQNAEGAAIRVTGPTEARGLIEDISATMAALEKILHRRDRASPRRTYQRRTREREPQERVDQRLSARARSTQGQCRRARFPFPPSAPLEELRARHAAFRLAPSKQTRSSWPPPAPFPENLVKGISKELVPRTSTARLTLPGRAPQAPMAARAAPPARLKGILSAGKGASIMKMAAPELPLFRRGEGLGVEGAYQKWARPATVDFCAGTIRSGVRAS